MNLLTKVSFSKAASRIFSRFSYWCPIYLMKTNCIPQIPVRFINCLNDAVKTPRDNKGHCRDVVCTKIYVYIMLLSSINVCDAKTFLFLISVVCLSQYVLSQKSFRRIQRFWQKTATDFKGSCAISQANFFWRCYFFTLIEIIPTDINWTIW